MPETQQYDLTISVCLKPREVWSAGETESQIILTGALDVLHVQTFTIGGIVQAACSRIVGAARDAQTAESADGAA